MQKDLSASVQTIATPREERRPTVFISYAHADEGFANQLIADLGTAGHTCWIDTTAIKGGDEWIRTIAEGILNSYAMVVIATLQAMQSRWVQDEILWARENNKLIIPLLLEDVANETRFLPLMSYQRVSVFGSDYTAGLQKLLRSLPSPILTDAGVGQAGAKEVAPGLTPATISQRKPLDMQRDLELAYLERLRLEELLDTERYTPISGASHEKRVEIRAIYEHQPFQLMSLGKSRQKEQEPRKFENAVEEIHRIRRAVLLGEPGGGKTTTIWKLAADLVETALREGEAPIPLLIRLGRWTDADQPFATFIASELGDLGKYFDLLLNEKRAALLLDGLNELPAGQRDAKYSQVQQLIEQNPKLMAIVSCRELDYTVDLGFDRINITPLDPLRIREFTGHYLGEEKGEALFWKLAGEAVEDTHRQFIQNFGSRLTDPDRVFWMDSQLPEAAQKDGWWWSKGRFWTWQDWVKKRETPSSLMVLAQNPYMLLMLTSVYAEENELPENRGELFRLFVETLLKREHIPESEHAPLTEEIAKVAYAMQIRRAGDNAGDALTVLPKEDVSAILGERLLYLTGSASILSVGEQVRFTHQLLQEYFAASYMDNEIRAGRLKATEIWPPGRWWQRTNWEEAAILLAGLYSDDCSSIVEWVAEANPEVAAMCIERSGAHMAEATRDRLRVQWIPRLTDLKRDPKPEARAAVGRALGMTRLDNRKGVGIVVGANNVALPDIDWVEIPAGEFQYGRKDQYNNPPQKLTLPIFHISRYPVTFAQFQTFLEDSAGIADPRWFEGMAIKENDRSMSEQYFKFANHPRESVNWYQAMAFCRWFSWRIGGGYDLKNISEWAVRLPTEFEWEKAARGTDGRIYPYKGKFDAAKGNTYETGIGQTSAPGIFPNGASPYGVMDLSGNVWEWCLSNYENPFLEAHNENLRTDKNRVLRGGSWADNLGYARAAYRSLDRPAGRSGNIGFRVVLGMRPPSH
jgi:formylglycine-generating enzyme required for sulfatase activity